MGTSEKTVERYRGMFAETHAFLPARRGSRTHTLHFCVARIDPGYSACFGFRMDALGECQNGRSELDVFERVEGLAEVGDFLGGLFWGEFAGVEDEVGFGHGEGC